VDIWYWLDSPAVHRSLSDRDEEELGAVSMLNRAHTAVDPKHFDAKEVDLLHYVAEQPEVQRILVNPAIKKALCARTHQAAWLRKVRPWWGHTYHFHMRLACPPDQKQCRPQAAPPPGPGCGADLAWWFSAQAAEQARKNAAAARRITPAQALAKKLARVPKACRAVLASAPK
jgi:penicillin-insensitive murein endopeptidase